MLGSSVLLGTEMRLSEGIIIYKAEPFFKFVYISNYPERLRDLPSLSLLQKGSVLLEGGVSEPSCSVSEHSPPRYNQLAPLAIMSHQTMKLIPCCELM